MRPQRIPLKALLAPVLVMAAESFKNPGKYPYFCEIHPSMRGTVEVVASR
jgi:hypothetical protein